MAQRPSKWLLRGILLGCFLFTPLGTGIRCTTNDLNYGCTINHARARFEPCIQQLEEAARDVTIGEDNEERRPKVWKSYQWREEAQANKQ